MNGSILTAKKAKLYCRVRKILILTGSTMSAQPSDLFCLVSSSLLAGVKSKDLLEGSGLPPVESFTIAWEQKQHVTLKVGYFTKMCNYYVRDLMEDTVLIENAI